MALEPHDPALDLQVDSKASQLSVGFLLLQLLDDLLCNLLVVSLHPARRQNGDGCYRQSEN